jgi:hypothetical protein
MCGHREHRDYRCDREGSHFDHPHSETPGS